MKRLIKGQLVIWVYKENILGIILSAFFFGGVVACSSEQATEKQLNRGYRNILPPTVPPLLLFRELMVQESIQQEVREVLYI